MAVRQAAISDPECRCRRLGRPAGNRPCSLSVADERRLRQDLAEALIARVSAPFRRSRAASPRICASQGGSQLSVAASLMISERFSFIAQPECCGIAMKPPNPTENYGFRLVATRAFH